jgi:hypothetical protein
MDNTTNAHKNPYRHIAPTTDLTASINVTSMLRNAEDHAPISKAKKRVLTALLRKHVNERDAAEDLFSDSLGRNRRVLRAVGLTKQDLV